MLQGLADDWGVLCQMLIQERNEHPKTCHKTQEMLEKKIWKHLLENDVIIMFVYFKSKDRKKTELKSTRDLPLTREKKHH